MPYLEGVRKFLSDRKNKNLAISAAATAMPVNPKSAATSATIKKITAQVASFHLLRRIASSNCDARFLNLTNPRTLRDTFSLRKQPKETL